MRGAVEYDLETVRLRFVVRVRFFRVIVSEERMGTHSLEFRIVEFSTDWKSPGVRWIVQARSPELDLLASFSREQLVFSERLLRDADDLHDEFIVVRCEPWNFKPCAADQDFSLCAFALALGRCFLRLAFFFDGFSFAFLLRDFFAIRPIFFLASFRLRFDASPLEDGDLAVTVENFKPWFSFSHRPEPF